MRYNDVIGLEYIKAHLQATVARERIAHAQLLVGPAGSGVLHLAIAYARDILCSTNDKGCHRRMDALAHPDLHFSFPVASTPATGSKPTTDHFIAAWREFLKEKNYVGLPDWYQHAGIEKKNAEIRVVEAQLIMKKLSLKSYEGGYKVLIIWAADHMNGEAANKLLKLIEEPPAKTIILMVAANEDRIINTIKSRCQIVHIPKLSAAAIAQGLSEKYQVDTATAQSMAGKSDGNFIQAVKFYQNRNEDTQFEEWVVSWVRHAFQAKKNPTVISSLLEWSETLAKLNRETQKRFLLYCLEFFRQAMLLNYKASGAVYMNLSSGFELQKFAPFITGRRMLEVQKQIEEAIFHIDRNANGKIVMTDLAIGMTRILHG